MLNNYLMSTQRASRAFYFNPEGQVGTGGIPEGDEAEAEVNRTIPPEEQAPTETETETTPDSKTH